MIARQGLYFIPQNLKLSKNTPITVEINHSFINMYVPRYKSAYSFH